MPKKNAKKTPQVALADQYRSCPKAPFLKRLGAYFFDVIALAAVLIMAIIIALGVVLVASKMGTIDLSAYRDATDYLSKSSIFIVYLTFIITGFFSYFWTKSGQTIGMKAWGLRVQNSDGSNISMMQSFIRLATSAFGLGNFLALLQNKNAFQDLWAECEVVVLTKELNNGKGFKGMGFMDEDKK